MNGLLVLFAADCQVLGRAAHSDLALSGPETPALLKLFELGLNASFHNAGESQHGSPIDNRAHAFNQCRWQRQGNPGFRFCCANRFHKRLLTTDLEVDIFARNGRLIASRFTGA